MKDTIEGLQQTHSEMLATAHDLGFEPPEELKVQFSDLEAGRTILKNLDALIQDWRAKNPVAPGEEKVQAASPKTSAKKRASSAKKKTPAAKAAKKLIIEQKSPEDPEPAKPKKEDTVAKKAVKSGKKTTAKKAAVTRTRVSFDENAKITWAGKDNPARGESGKFDRIEGVRKANGKTVKTFRAGGGKDRSLGWCVKAGLAKVA